MHGGRIGRSPKVVERRFQINRRPAKEALCPMPRVPEILGNFKGKANPHIVWMLTVIVCSFLVMF